MNNIYSRILISIFFSGFTALYSINALDIPVLVPAGIGVAIIFLLSFYFLGKYDLLNEIKKYKNYSNFKKSVVIISTILCTFTLIRNSILLISIGYTKFMVGDLIIYKNFVLSFIVIVIIAITIIGLVNFFILWCLLANLFYNKIKNFFITLSKFEKRVIYIYVLLFTIINFIILLFTNAFIFSIFDGEKAIDTIFTLDTSYIMAGSNGLDSFSTPTGDENDTRHLLFGVISLPLAMICMPLAYLISFLVVGFDITIFSWHYTVITIYGYLLSIGQALLFSLSGILLYKMLRKEIGENLSKLFLVLFLISFSTIFYTVAIEQYAVSTFTVLLFVYHVMNKFDSKISFVMASLSITSSFALLPLVFLQKNINIKTIKNTLIGIAALIIIGMLYFGQLPELARTYDRMKMLSDFADASSVNITDKLVQYFGFISTIFIAPNVVFYDGWLKIYQLAPFFEILGLLLFIFLIYCIIINRHKKIIIISTYWVLISFIILVVIGWGSVENYMVIYNSYFGWAFLILFALGYSKIFGNKVLGNSLLILIISVLSIYNATEFIHYIKNIGTFR